MDEQQKIDQEIKQQLEQQREEKRLQREKILEKKKKRTKWIVIAALLLALLLVQGLLIYLWTRPTRLPSNLHQESTYASKDYENSSTKEHTKKPTEEVDANDASMEADSSEDSLEVSTESSETEEISTEDSENTSTATTDEAEGSAEETEASSTKQETEESSEETESAPSSTEKNESKETRPAETKPAETKPTETEPVETKPVETKPAETEPETQPEETEPVVTPPAASGTPVAQHGKLSVSGTNLIDQNGTPYQLKGVSTHGIAWFPAYVNKAAFQTMRDAWGVNVVRLAMYSAENNGYCTGGNKTELKKLVCKGVDAATELGMYVIIDWHVLGEGNPKLYQSEAISFFREMSAKYKNNINVIYEICNEPNGGVSWSEIKSYAEAVIPVIKENDPDAIIIVGTPNWSQQVGQAAANPIKGYSNIMYALHFYAATHTDWLRNDMISAINAGLPIFVSEYGICDASGNGGIDEYQANQWVAVMNKYNVSYVAWNLSNKSETSAMIVSNCSKTSGWSVSELSASGQWFVKMMTGGLNLPEVDTGSNTGNTGSSDTGNNNTNTGDTNTGNNSGNQNAGNAMTTGTTVTGESSGCAGTLKVTNAWQNASTAGYQLDVSMKNSSGAEKQGWKLVLTFTGTVTVDQIWNGTAQVQGSTLVISPVDWNTNVASGSEVTAGMIVTTSYDFAITGVTVQ